jgi:transcriptional regulator with XRE-family HTH domain
MSTIGKRLKTVRTEKHLTQTELGDILGLSKQAIANVESEHNNPSIEFISKLIENLGVNSNWLITGKGNKFNAPEFEDVKGEILKQVDDILVKYGVKNK